MPKYQSSKLVSVYDHVDNLIPIGSAHSELQKEQELEAAITVPEEELVASYYDYRQQLDQMATDFTDVVTHPNYCLPFLSVGRLVKVKYQDLDFGWGILVNYQKRLPPKVCLRRCMIW